MSADDEGGSFDLSVCRRSIQRGGDVWVFAGADLRHLRRFPLRVPFANYLNALQDGTPRSLARPAGPADLSRAPVLCEAANCFTGLIGDRAPRSPGSTLPAQQTHWHLANVSYAYLEEGVAPLVRSSMLVVARADLPSRARSIGMSIAPSRYPPELNGWNLRKGRKNLRQ